LISVEGIGKNHQVRRV